MGDWSRLPEGILVLIAKSMQSVSDAHRFRSVCTSWRSSVPPPKPPLRFKIPTYDPHVADHFYLEERTIYLVGSPRTLKFYFVKGEEDEHGTMHLLHPLTSSKIESSAFQIVLDTLNLNLFEWGKEYVLQYKPKNQAACESLEYYDEHKLAFKRAVFRSLSQDSEDFELLLELFLGGLALFKSADMQWTRLDDISTHISNPRREIFMMQSAGGFIKVEIRCRHEYYTRFERRFNCLKPNGELVCFRICIFKNNAWQDWVVENGLGDLVLFLGTNRSFVGLGRSSFLKGTCIIFSETRWKSKYAWGQYTHQKGHDIYVADLHTLKFYP